MSIDPLREFEATRRQCVQGRTGASGDRRFAIQWFASPGSLEPTGAINARCLGCLIETSTTVEPHEIDDALTLLNGELALRRDDRDPI